MGGGEYVSPIFQGGGRPPHSPRSWPPLLTPERQTVKDKPSRRSLSLFLSCNYCSRSCNNVSSLSCTTVPTFFHRATITFLSNLLPYFTTVPPLSFMIHYIPPSIPTVPPLLFPLLYRHKNINTKSNINMEEN